MRKIFIAAAVIVVLVFFLAGGCGDLLGTGKKTSEGDAAKPVNEIKVSASKFSFTPSIITVKKGERIRLLLKSTDVTHGIAVSGYNINKELPPNVETPVEFTADKTGEFTIMCSVYCGSEHSGMKGKLVVTE